MCLYISLLNVYSVFLPVVVKIILYHFLPLNTQLKDTVPGTIEISQKLAVRHIIFLH